MSTGKQHLMDLPEVAAVEPDSVGLTVLEAIPLGDVLAFTLEMQTIFLPSFSAAEILSRRLTTILSFRELEEAAVGSVSEWGLDLIRLVVVTTLEDSAVQASPALAPHQAAGAAVEVSLRA